MRESTRVRRVENVRYASKRCVVEQDQRIKRSLVISLSSYHRYQGGWVSTASFSL